MSEITVRVQKVRKSHIKQKLMIFSILAAGLVLLAIFSDHLCPYDPYAQDLSCALQAPSLQHPMGTDTYGRDMLSRVISGARASIFSTFIFILFLIKNTIAAPSTVPNNGIPNPNNNCIIITFFIHLLLN